MAPRPNAPTIFGTCCALTCVAWLVPAGPATAQPVHDPRPTLELAFRLPRDGVVFFAAAADADVLPDESILVLDPLNDTIYRFSADGEFLDSLGRSGQGPGELRQPIDLEVGPAGEIAVTDGTNGRITFWAPDRTLAGSTRIRGWQSGLWWRPQGLFLKWFRIGADATKTVHFSRIRPGADTLPPPFATFTFERDPKTLRTTGLSCDLCPAAIGPAGEMLLVDPDPVAYRVVQVRDGQQVARVWERPGLPAVEFTQAELAMIRQSMRRVGERFEPDRFRHRPRVAAIDMDQDGRLWVLRRMPEPEPYRIDVWGPDRSLWAEFPVPRGIHHLMVRRGRVLAIGETEAGEPTVYVYRLRT